jgi:Tol biopolymer transport system component
MDADGGNLKSLMTKGGAKPSWSPDGKKLVYSNSNPEKAEPGLRYL